ncbi:MAG: peroxiredoxin [Candidatus Bathyarchaeota archaeon]|nr:peroxiredoxin [Candidatus Bathyarchaeota archaeon]
MPNFKVGTKSPDFTLKDQDSDPVSLSDYKGKSNVVLFFYPKDFSPGCTAEARGFRDIYEDIIDLDAVVIGVSGDSIESHKRWADRHMLPFTLLSDPKRKIQFLYGATKAFGLLPGRYTFVIDKGGVIRHIFTSEINMKKHIAVSLKALREITE